MLAGLRREQQTPRQGHMDAQVVFLFEQLQKRCDTLEAKLNETIEKLNSVLTQLNTNEDYGPDYIEKLDIG